MKKVPIRKFDYQPRFYNPDKDPEIRRKQKLGFRSNFRSKTSSKKPLAYIIVFMVVLYFFLKYNGYIQ